MSPCPICLRNYDHRDSTELFDHRQYHRLLACGGVPIEIAEFQTQYRDFKTKGIAGILALRERVNPDIVRLAAAYAWWDIALSAGIDQEEFTRFMTAHLELARALTGEGDEKSARDRVREWARFVPPVESPKSLH
ncbi:hypothetical protein HNP46_000503 [Pseudomonas nitritireducens]|uniref:Uncharacterized protein n=1 Tax=Pseudomonas nitroreducens TaxID=46680 RepID=A0A7W7KF39_PSENT|nr:hypothetical protein [Pseudomonas nitritireducens]MBB4861692.1 hypothetical protein [Pseudomonas nitritireducens]